VTLNASDKRANCYRTEQTRLLFHIGNDREVRLPNSPMVASVSPPQKNEYITKSK